MPALPRLRLLGVEPPRGDRLPELRLRGDGGEAVQGDGGHGGHAEVPEVRTRSDGRGGRPGGTVGGLTAAVVGGGLAGSEAAWALAERGVAVTLREMRPVRMTAAHQTDRLAELVCSNSFKSVELTSAHGLLKAEMRRLGSLVLEAADAAQVPGGAALAVDRVAFADHVQQRVSAHPKITVAREEATALPSPGVVATGPLTSEALAGAIARRLDATALAFFDAIAPIVSDESLDHDRLFRASRYGKGGGDDYWNAPLTASEYDAFVTALCGAEQHRPHHDFDRAPYFEGCLPIEELAERGRDTLRFGPMKPVGLRDPRARARGQGGEPYAVVQLRQEDRAGQIDGEAPLVPPPTTMLGALYRYVHSADRAHFQPMNANFGLLEPLAQPVRDKQRKKQLLVERALAEIDHFAERIGVSKNAECGVRNAE